MASNSSSVVISFSVAILLLLILLLLLSYNSKSKRDNMENFYNTNEMSLPSLINPMGTFSEVMNKFSSNASRNEGFYNSVATNDGYAKNALSGDNGNMMGYEANQVVPNYASLNGEKELSKFTNFEGFENQDPSACIKKEKLTSTDLLPKDAQNLKWANINPTNTAELGDQNFLTAGYNIGVVGQSLRNANLQLRSEIPNPQVAVSPWLISTIEPDVRSTTLEIGSAPSY